MSAAYPAGNRFAVDLPDQHKAWLWVISILSLIYSVVILATRLAVKWGFFGMDDLVLGIAYVVSLVHWILIYIALQNGLGVSANLISAAATIKIAQMVFASRILLLISLALSKACVVLFIRQLFTRENKKAWWICTIVLGLVVAWGLISAIVVSAGCPPNKALVGSDEAAVCTNDVSEAPSVAQALETPPKCQAAKHKRHNQLTQFTQKIIRWRIVTAIDVVFEALLVALPAWLFSTVHMSLERKVIVTTAFAFRLLGSLLFIAYLVSYTAFLRHGATNIGIVESLAWQEALIAYGLMSATIPTLKGFMGRFKTADLVRIDQTQFEGGYARYGGGSGTRGQNRSNAYAMESMKSATHESGQIKLRPEQPMNATEVYAGGRGPLPNNRPPSEGSGGSEQMIIHRRVDWEVETESTRSESRSNLH